MMQVDNELLAMCLLDSPDPPERWVNARMRVRFQSTEFTRRYV